MSQCYSWSLFQRGGTAMAMERSANFSDEVTDGRSSVMAEEERVERDVWIEGCVKCSMPSCKSRNEKSARHRTVKESSLKSTIPLPLPRSNPLSSTSITYQVPFLLSSSPIPALSPLHSLHPPPHLPSFSYPSYIFFIFTSFLAASFNCRRRQKSGGLCYAYKASHGHNYPCYYIIITFSSIT